MFPYDIYTILNFIFILAIPVFLFILSLVALWQILQTGRRGTLQLAELNNLLEQVTQPGEDNQNNIQARISLLKQAEISEPLLDSALKDLAVYSEQQHNNNWLYDPASRLNKSYLLSSYEQKVLRGLWGRVLLLLCFLSAAAAAFSLFFVPRDNIGIALSLLLAAPITGAALYYLLNIVTHTVADKAENNIHLMNRSMLNNYPVFNEQTGLARLSGSMFEYEQTIKDNLIEFDKTAKKLVEGEFSEGVNKSIRSIMSEEISPPIIQAADTLSQLATDLTQRQEKGMADLATQFAAAVTGSLEEHLKPLNDHLGKLNQLIAETEAYVGVSVKTLETSREQNIALNQDISEALRLMTLSKNDLANEMLEIRDYLESIGDSTNRLARLYQGEDRSLSLHISNLANQIDVFSDRLNIAINESTSALKLAAEMTQKQEEYGTKLLSHLDEQVHNLSEINRTIRDNTTHFTSESAQFVHKTLSEYDDGLGEVVERLSFVVAEIRDAIDGLPMALRLTGEGTGER